MALVVDPRVHNVAQAFSSQTTAYENARPSYPHSAIDFILTNTTLNETKITQQQQQQQQEKEKKKKITVVDLAAGTGKFTRLLPFEHPEVTVVGVEPAPGMRETFSQVLPNVKILDAVATNLPFDNHSVDVLTVAQGIPPHIHTSLSLSLSLLTLLFHRISLVCDFRGIEGGGKGVEARGFSGVDLEHGGSYRGLGGQVERHLRSLRRRGHAPISSWRLETSLGGTKGTSPGPPRSSFI
jgi:SAM-dependent methyltransferase